MRSPKAIAVTAVMTLIAGALAYGAWDQIRAGIALVLDGPARQFVFEFRFALGVLAVFVVLTLGEMVVSRAMNRFRSDG